MKNWIKEHFDTLAIVGTIVAATWTIKSDMHAMDIRLTAQIHELDTRLSKQIAALENRVIVIETVMIMQGAPIRAIAAENEKKLKD